MRANNENLTTDDEIEINRKIILANQIEQDIHRKVRYEIIPWLKKAIEESPKKVKIRDGKIMLWNLKNDLEMIDSIRREIGDVFEINIDTKFYGVIKLLKLTTQKLIEKEKEIEKTPFDDNCEP